MILISKARYTEVMVFLAVDQLERRTSRVRTFILKTKH